MFQQANLKHDLWGKSCEILYANPFDEFLYLLLIYILGVHIRSVHLNDFKLTGSTCALLLVGMTHAFGTVSHVQQKV